VTNLYIFKSKKQGALILQNCCLICLMVKQIGKHNAATHDQIISNGHFISSIRNPWDWYISLWAFGVEGKGGLFNRLTKRNFLHSLKSGTRPPPKKIFNHFYELTRNVTSWHDVYDKSDKVESFRKWLKLIHNPCNSHLLGEGYGNTVISNLCGFMTYRYLKLCYKKVKN